MIDKKSEIYKAGKELFAAKGFKDTNVAEIMKLAGFSTGTFYNYYKSKDQLFMEIYNEENIVLKRSIIDSADPSDEPLAVMRGIILQNLQGMRANPILREWYNKDVFEKIEENFREANGLDHVDFLYDRFIEFVRQWQEEGRIRSDIDAEMIMAIFVALVNVDLHKEEIGVQFFPKIMDYLASFIMQGLQPDAKIQESIFEDE